MKYSKTTKDQLIKELVKTSQRIRKLEAKEKEGGKKKDKLQNILKDLESIFNSAKDLIMVLDTKFNIIKANLATSRFLKIPVGEIVGRTCYKLIHGIDIPPRECPLNMINKTRKHEEVECYIAEKDIWLQVSSDPIFDENGKVTKIVHIIRDITEFRRTEASLRESEGRFRAVFDYANHGIYIMDMRERKTLMVNKTLSQMLGYSKEEFKKLSVNDIYPQEDVLHIMEQFRKLLREEIDIARNISLLRKNGSLLYANVSASPFMLGGKTYLMCIFRDIMEHRTS
jgi:PAS domain S-box-containing protein